MSEVRRMKDAAFVMSILLLGIVSLTVGMALAIVTWPYRALRGALHG
jgi:hypothetical protein